MSPRHRIPLRSLVRAFPVVLVAVTATAQGSARPAYPVIPRFLPDSAEIRLAMTAAPAEISGRATIYTIREGEPVVIRQGTNGVTCMVSRDLHEGSLYPICYDREGSRTLLQRELLEVSLRAQGKSEDEVRGAVGAARAAGRLREPSVISVAYMLSPHQVLFASPLADGVRVGAWFPHLMISGPGLSHEAMGLAAESTVDQFMVQATDGHHTELVVKLAEWSDGKKVAPGQ